MRTYLVLVNFRPEEDQVLKEVCWKTTRVCTDAERHGVRLRDLYRTSGIYDAVLIADASGDEEIKNWTSSLGHSQAIQVLSAAEQQQSCSMDDVRSYSLSEIIQWSY